MNATNYMRQCKLVWLLDEHEYEFHIANNAGAIGEKYDVRKKFMYYLKKYYIDADGTMTANTYYVSQNKRVTAEIQFTYGAYNPHVYEAALHFFADLGLVAEVYFVNVRGINLVDVYSLLDKYNIAMLYFYNCAFTKIISDKSAYTYGIEKLIMYQCNLTNCPTLPDGLVHLDLQYNKLREIKDITFPRGLEVLNLKHNNIKIIDFKHANLRELDISENYITELRNIPQSIKVLIWKKNMFVRSVKYKKDIIARFCANNKDLPPDIISLVRKYGGRKDLDYTSPVILRPGLPSYVKICINPITYIGKLPAAAKICSDYIPYIMEEDMTNLVWMSNFAAAKEMLLTLFGYPNLINIIRDYSISPVFYRRRRHALY